MQKGGQYILDNGGRRSFTNRREFLYAAHIPERRSFMERRSGNDRRIPRFSGPGDTVLADADTGVEMVKQKIMSLS